MSERQTKKQKLSTSSDGSRSIETDDKLGNQPKHTLYVNNLFSIYGEVIKITVNPRRQRGQAFITMKNIDESNLAIISLNNEPFFGKPLHVSFSREETINI